MRACIKLLILVFILMLSNTVFSGPMDPPLSREIITAPATLKVDPVKNISLGSFVAEFEKTTLNDIRNTLGSSLIHHNGDTAESQYWLCYSLPSQRVWFISDGEMGGSDHALTQVKAVPINSTSKKNVLCPQIPTQFQSVSLSFGWIGTTRDLLMKTLGQPSGIEDGHLIYYYAGKKKDSSNGRNVEWDIIGYVEAVIVDNKISSLEVSHVTSN